MTWKRLKLSSFEKNLSFLYESLRHCWLAFILKLDQYMNVQDWPYKTPLGHFKRGKCEGKKKESYNV
jgi:hypothetical protein